MERVRSSEIPMSQHVEECPDMQEAARTYHANQDILSGAPPRGTVVTIPKGAVLAVPYSQVQVGGRDHFVQMLEPVEVTTWYPLNRKQVDIELPDNFHYYCPNGYLWPTDE